MRAALIGNRHLRDPILIGIAAAHIGSIRPILSANKAVVRGFRITAVRRVDSTRNDVVAILSAVGARGAAGHAGTVKRERGGRNVNLAIAVAYCSGHMHRHGRADIRQQSGHESIRTVRGVGDVHTVHQRHGILCFNRRRRHARSAAKNIPGAGIDKHKRNKCESDHAQKRGRKNAGVVHKDKKAADAKNDTTLPISISPAKQYPGSIVE